MAIRLFELEVITNIVGHYKGALHCCEDILLNLTQEHKVPAAYVQCGLLHGYLTLSLLSMFWNGLLLTVDQSDPILVNIGRRYLSGNITRHHNQTSQTDESSGEGRYCSS